VIGISPATRERGHEDAVFELESAGGEWGEELHGIYDLRFLIYDFSSAWSLM
jgi:hypothetical protein